MRSICLVSVALALVDCGHSSSTTAVSSNYTVGGSISGLTVSSVVLENGARP
jgi:hypothetical protein